MEAMSKTCCKVTLLQLMRHIKHLHRTAQITVPRMAHVGHWGRTGIFNLRIRYARVVRFIPSRAAAPWGPPITQLDSRIARRTCSRSASSRVLSFELRP